MMKEKYSKHNTLKTMDIKDIKVGETYNVRVKVECIDEDGWFKVRTSEKAISFVLSPKEQEAFSLLPKYDPCRKFRKGDKAKPRIINGREIPKMPLDVIFTVTGDEDEYGAVPVEYMSPVRGLLTSTTVHAVWLELVTPVEARVSFRVGDSPVDGEWSVWKDSFGKTEIISSYKIATHPHAKEAAEAERDRLNAEWRKEQE